MIRLTLTSGPYAERSRSFSDKIADDGSVVDANELLGSLVNHGWSWEIDLSSASAEESFIWGRADMVARIVRAVMERRPVWVLTRRFEPIGDPSTIVGMIEDEIVESGRLVYVASDDERGVVIGAHGYEE